MTGERRPLLALSAPEVGKRFKQNPAQPPRVSKASGSRQGERLNPQFQALTDAFDHERARLADAEFTEVDPELVLVFDLAGTVEDFYRAVEKIPGLEFLSELLEDDVDPDDDFHVVGEKYEERDKDVSRSLYLVMSNAQAARELVRLFSLWQSNPTMAFERGLTRFRYAFEQLRAIRPWGPEDRIRDTGLLEAWRDHLELVGQTATTIPVEVELWYRQDSKKRAEAEARLRGVIESSGGQVKARAQIDPIGYHALLAELPVKDVRSVLSKGAGAIRLLTADEIMFASPHEPMSVTPSPNAHVPIKSRPMGSAPADLPRIALLDGLPFANHDLLAGRLNIDDPEGLAGDYPVSSRHHGTSMASLIIHGDLSANEPPLERPLHVRPIMRPHEFQTNQERVLDNWLFPDLLHRAIVRMQDGEGGRAPTASSVRIVNLSVGVPTRALVRQMSPVGRLLDWLAVRYNLLFVVSAGNHHRLPLRIPGSAVADISTARAEAVRAARQTGRLRGILPPGDAINALTVGATHHDAAEDPEESATVWDLTERGSPALYGAVGPGIGRSVKPEIHHVGGRALYPRPVGTSDESTELYVVESPQVGPGTLSAAPDRRGATNAQAYSFGTSNAAALVSREASRLFDVLEMGRDEDDDPSVPDPLFHPVLVRALLVHASSWGTEAERLRRVLQFEPRAARRELTALLGYGAVDPRRVGYAATNRAVLISGGLIGGDERHSYTVPLPSSLRRSAGWHRVTVTLTSMAPTIGHLTKYRAAKVFFESLDERIAGGSRAEAEYRAARRGSCQHEIIEGSQAMVFADGEGLPVDVQCMKDAVTFKKDDDRVRYGLVVSVETKVETSTTVHDEIRAQLKTQVGVQSRPRLR